MTEDIDKHVLKKYEVAQKLGKGVCCCTTITSTAATLVCVCLCVPHAVMLCFW
jgi:hypothetical protein